MRPLRRLLDGTPTDPQGVVFRRALRVTVVAVPLFAVLGPVLGRNDAAVSATFAVFCLGNLADFWGRPRRRFERYLVAGGVAMLMYPLAELASVHTAVLLVVTALVAFVTFLSGTLGGAFFSARFPVMIAFLSAASIAPSGSAIVGSMVGWAIGAVAMAVASVTLWPVHVRFPVRALTGSAGALAGARLRTIAGVDAGEDAGGGSDRADADGHGRRHGHRHRDDHGEDHRDARPLDRRLTEVMDQLRSTTLEAHLAPGALARDERLISEAAHQVERLVAAVELLPADGHPTPDDAALADVVARVLDRIDEVLHATPAEALALAPLPVDEMRAALERHVDAARDRLAAADGGPDAAEVVAHQVGACPVRSVGSSTLVLAELVEGWRSGTGAPPSTTLGVRRGDGPWESLRVHLDVRSLWFRNAVRAAVALTLAMALARAGAGFDHGFWITLGAFSVLRADLSTMRRSAGAAVLGTAIGYVVASGLILLIGDSSLIGWVVLPVAVFVAAWSGQFRQEATSAAFTVFVVLLFTLVEPDSGSVAEVRFLTVVMGALVTLVVGAILWPRVGTVPEGALAGVVGRARAFLAQAGTRALGRPVDGDVAAPEGDPLALLTETDRVLDMLASSAPASLPAGTREPLVGSVDAAVDLTAILSGEPSDVGIAGGIDLDWIAADDEAAAAVAGDLDDVAVRLGDLSDRLTGHRARPPGRGDPVLIRSLASARLAAGGTDREQLVTLVRLGSAVCRTARAADAVPGLGRAHLGG